MSKKLRVRTLMESQYVEGSETLHKCARQYFCHIFWSLWKKISWKSSGLVVSATLRLFFNILTPDDQYSLSKSECLRQSIQIQLSPNQKLFSQFFLNFRNLHKIGILWKKRWVWELIFFWNYRLQKAGLLKCPKNRVSGHLRTVNMLKVPKHSINLHGSIFLIFFDQSERKSAQKTLL